MKFKILDLVIVLLFLLFVYFVLTRIFGHSATDFTIMITLFTILGGLLYNLNREFGEFKVKTVHGFGKVREDIKEIDGKLIRIESYIKKK